MEEKNTQNTGIEGIMDITELEEKEIQVKTKEGKIIIIVCAIAMITAIGYEFISINKNKVDETWSEPIDFGNARSVRPSDKLIKKEKPMDTTPFWSPDMPEHTLI